MEIDILKAKKVFKQYVEKYNPEDEKIKSTYRKSISNCKKIGRAT